MPIFDYDCPICAYQEEVLVSRPDEDVDCPRCSDGFVAFPMQKLITSAPSFKIKGARAANGYGAKYEDTYGRSPVDDRETGCSFTSNRGGTVEHKFGGPG